MEQGTQIDRGQSQQLKTSGDTNLQGTDSTTFLLQRNSTDRGHILAGDKDLSYIATTMKWTDLY